MMDEKFWLTLSVSLLALCLSIVNFLRTSQTADRQLVIQFTQDVHKWADQVLALYAEVSNPRIDLERAAYLNILSTAAAKTSALWDSGRLLFPNHEAGDFGRHKGVAYKGIRPKVLDTMKAMHKQIVDDYRLVESSLELTNKARYNDLKREFVSCVQAEIATRVRYRSVRRLLRSNALDYREAEAKALADQK